MNHATENLPAMPIAAPDQTTRAKLPTTRGQLLTEALGVLDMLISRLSDDPEFEYMYEVRRSWEADLLFAAGLSPNLGVPDRVASAFSQLVEGVARLPREMIP